jgi:hypothetical protein
LLNLAAVKFEHPPQVPERHSGSSWPTDRPGSSLLSSMTRTLLVLRV